MRQGISHLRIMSQGVKFHRNHYVNNITPQVDMSHMHDPIVQLEIATKMASLKGQKTALKCIRHRSQALTNMYSDYHITVQFGRLSRKHIFCSHVSGHGKGEECAETAWVYSM